MIIVSAFDDNTTRPCFVSFELDAVGFSFEVEAHVYDADGVQGAYEYFNFSPCVPSQIRRAIIIDRLAMEHRIIISESEFEKMIP